MQITLNGKLYTFKQGSTLLALSETLQLETTQVAIEHNGKIVSRSLYGDTAICENDAIEIVTFIGGG